MKSSCFECGGEIRRGFWVEDVEGYVFLCKNCFAKGSYKKVSDKILLSDLRSDVERVGVRFIKERGVLQFLKPSRKYRRCSYCKRVLAKKRILFAGVKFFLCDECFNFIINLHS